MTANITLAGVNIDASSSLGCALDLGEAGVSTVTISGSNTLKSAPDAPGIYVPNGNKLTLTGSGSLHVTGGNNSAGIGRNGGGNIEIQSGTVEATGGSGVAGIGGNRYDAVGDIVISGGKVTATGGMLAAGIGGGSDGAGGNIVISGGTVNAGTRDTTGGVGGAGIGNGQNGAGGSIVISGGTVSAAGNPGVSAMDIGAGSGGSNVEITITGGSVYPARGANMVGPQPKNGGGSPVYLNTLTLFGGFAVTDGSAVADGLEVFWFYP